MEHMSVIHHTGCPYHPGIVCGDGKTCPGGQSTRCGWAPAEAARRRALPLARDAATGLWRKFVGEKEA